MNTAPRAQRQRFLDGAAAAIVQARRFGIARCSPDVVDLEAHTAQFVEGYTKAWGDLLAPHIGATPAETRAALDAAERTIAS